MPYGIRHGATVFGIREIYTRLLRLSGRVGIGHSGNRRAPRLDQTDWSATVQAISAPSSLIHERGRRGVRPEVRPGAAAGACGATAVADGTCNHSVCTGV
jgi:hypothetical protein